MGEGQFLRRAQFCIRRRELIAMLGGAVVAWPFVARAQTGRKPLLIGCLYAGRQDADTSWLSAFEGGMRDLGYVEGQGVDLAYRFADGNYAALPALAAELASLKPDVIVAAEPPAALAAKNATSSIPIVSPILVDPVKLGLVASYRRPGGNVTGILVRVEGLMGKQLELLRELVPGAATIGVLVNPKNASGVLSQQDLEAAGSTTGIKMITAEAATTTDLDAAFKALIAAGTQALVVVADPMFISQRERIGSLAAAAYLATISNAREFVEVGALVAYGVSLAANFHRATYFVDKILNGAKAADLPVEFPTKIEMVLNLKTAKALGLTIPPTLLARADEVIE
jgi:putative tryptophan/tyrosine transport system substrate-binding protein